MYVIVPTIVHSLISFAALAAGLAVLLDLLRKDDRPAMVKLFLLTAFLTSASGFLFPVTEILPSHITAVIALLVLLPTWSARYRFRLLGAWRWVYAGGAVASLYFIVFVLIVQIFMKTPALRQAAEKAEPPFAITQGIVLLIFLALGLQAVRKFRPA
ncbi:hypothetical protein V6B08_16055 [Ferrovibrio sp. MS7]|uniref:hypothetical protein n=1 Tax=Ferrovibrio plantarum TaxID=3119164 RepID=UPI003136B62C